MVAHHVVRDLLAAVLEQERDRDVRVRQVTPVGAVQELVHRFPAEAAPLGVGEAQKARDPGRPPRGPGVQALRRQPRDLGGTEAGGQHEAHPLGRVASVRSPEDRQRRRGRPRRAGRGHGERAPVRRDSGAQRGETGGVGLPPIAPQGNLRVPGPLALGPHPARRRQQQLETVRHHRIHRLTVQITPGVEVHLVPQQLVAPGRGRDLEGRNEREIGDRAVAGDEQDQVAAGPHLPRDPLQVIARPVHKREPRRRQVAQRLCVLDQGVQPAARVLLVHRPERFERDIVQPAEPVAGRRVAFRGEPVPRHLVAEPVQQREEGPRRRRIAHVPQQVRFPAHRLVGLSQDARRAVADRLVHERPRQRIPRDPRKCIRTAALQGDAEAT